jgi:hypothetical protein
LIIVADQVKIYENMIGIVIRARRRTDSDWQIAGKYIEGHNNFRDFDEFLDKGGNRGLQPQVMLAGSYYINTWVSKSSRIR